MTCAMPTKQGRRPPKGLTERWLVVVQRMVTILRMGLQGWRTLV
jgi:hypothetical protein